MDNRELLKRATDAKEHAKATADEDLRARWSALAEAWLETARERRDRFD